MRGRSSRPSCRPAQTVLAHVGEAHQRVHTSSSVAQFQHIHAGALRTRVATLLRARCGGGGEAGRGMPGHGCRQTAARRFPRPGRSAGPDRAAAFPGDRSAAPRSRHGAGQLAERLFPARRADEIGNDEHQRAARIIAAAVCRTSLQIGGAARLATAGSASAALGCAATAAARRAPGSSRRPAPEKQRAGAVAVPAAAGTSGW